MVMGFGVFRVVQLPPFSNFRTFLSLPQKNPYSLAITTHSFLLRQPRPYLLLCGFAYSGRSTYTGWRQVVLWVWLLGSS